MRHTVFGLCTRVNSKWIRVDPARGPEYRKTVSLTIHDGLTLSSEQKVVGPRDRP